MTIYVGLDDSGRGPVIGPMVVAAVALNLTQNNYLKSLGVKDSKLLSRTKRKYLEKEIKRNCITYKLRKIFPEEIDKKLKLKINLNKIEAIKFAKLINEIYSHLLTNKNLHKEKIYVVVDCPSTNIKRWKQTLLGYINSNVIKNIVLIAKHKAEKHTYVAAASILAKETREREIYKLKKLIGFDFGSGYSSDPLTINFLNNNYKRIKNMKRSLYLVRESWATIKKIDKKKKQKNLKEFFN